jgi:ubiquinone/menaquinone biosynthesis C-methylase UbiE
MTAFPKIFELEFLINLQAEDQLYNEVSDQFHEVTKGFYATANFELLKHLRLSRKSRVLELACGTGHLAMEIAKSTPDGKVVGVDLSPQMIACGREESRRLGLKNIAFIERNIHHILPEFKPKDFDVGLSCFALSYLGCNFLLNEFRRILGETGQVGITTSSINSLVEWQPLLLEFLMGPGGKAFPVEGNLIPDMPLNADDMKQRMETAGFENVQVLSQKIPLIFENSAQAASFLISTGWISNYFFRIRDKETRRELLNWALKRIDEHHQKDPHISTSIEFLVAWNEP